MTNIVKKAVVGLLKTFILFVFGHFFAD